MATEITLTNEELSLFIELWEAHRCLWDPSDIDYKCRAARQNALSSIAAAFGRGWSAEDVRRKVESVKAYYRKLKNKRRAGSTSGKTWVFFDRIHGFLGCVTYNTSTVKNSDAGETLSDDDNGSPWGEHNVTSFPAGHSPTRGSGSRNCETPDIKLQTSHLHLADEKSATRACSTSVDICEPRLCEEGLSPLKKKRALGPSHSPTSGLEEVAINFIESLKEARKSNNEYLNYGLTVADRLAKIQSARRLSVLKHKIDTLIHEAMMEEMPD
ncbi:uncharacterized protein LOC112558763 [Pomacea canaliculata]|uniref:uncharacterized protein LOC112558763 n=1 Tax=Pomacea canaliculata TaxID=400727 RepID=UPI000D732EFF|nr:uncharacterized protein LOC112558763 [Pomacea canaliculata]